MPSVSPGTVSAGSSELLERADELSALGNYLEAVQRSSRGRVVLVGGEAGVGKTALLRRFCDGCGQSARILWGRSSTSPTSPVEISRTSSLAARGRTKSFGR